MDEVERKIKGSRTASPEEVARDFLRSPHSWVRSPIGGKDPPRRNMVIVGALAIVVVLAVLVVAIPTKSKPPVVRTLSPDARAQVAADAAAVKAGCPAHPSTGFDAQLSTQPTSVLALNSVYAATITTTAGDFSISLYTGSQPVVGNDFVYLANAGSFHCVAFDQVTPDGIAVVGSPISGLAPQAPSGSGDNLPVGSVVTALSGEPDIGASQWFVVGGGHVGLPSGEYVVFGRVISGLNVVQKIDGEGSASGVPPRVIQRILSVSIIKTTAP